MNFDLILSVNCLSKKSQNNFKKYAIDCGEDFYFSNFNKFLNTYFFGLSDGVGGISEYNIDPSIFAKHISNVFSYFSKKTTNPNLHSLLTKVCHYLLKSNVQGASTFCALSFNKNNGILKSLNIGDSGFLILRPDSSGNLHCLIKSKSQQFSFNAPFQLSNIHNSSNFSKILPLADNYKIQLYKRDLIIVGTDGLFDNLFIHEIISFIQPFYNKIQKIKDIKYMTNQLLEFCINSYKLNRKGPWIVQALNHDYTKYYEYSLKHNNKLDDTTILIGLVV